MTASADQPSPDSTAATAFLAGGGVTGAEIRALDWRGNPLGRPEHWPAALKSTLATVLSSPQPMYLAWGPALIAFFNDAFRPILGLRAQGAVGRPFAELWSDIWAEIEPLVSKSLAGEGARLEDLRLVTTRNGYPEETWWTFCYMPLRDDTGAVPGMLCVCAETTGQKLAHQRQVAESECLRRMFEQAPAFMAMLRGPEHIYELANIEYLRVIDNRAIVGKPVRVALPEFAGHGFFELLDQVYATGEAYSERAARITINSGPNGEPETRFIDFIYQPITDPQGAVTGIFVEGSDVSEAKQAEDAQRTSAARQMFRVELRDGLRDLHEPEQIMQLTDELIGPFLGVDQAVYYLVDEAADQITVVRNWNNGRTFNLRGCHRLSEFGPAIVEPLRRGLPLLIDDTTTVEASEPFATMGIRAFLSVPVIRDGRFIAGLHVDQAQPRAWHPEEVALLQEVADRTWAAIERVRAEQSLRQLNETLEARVDERTRELQEVEEHLRQSQKMEAIGQLTGGIAHDFNNILAGVIGGLDIVQRRLASGRYDDVDRFIDAATQSAQRAARLTQRLLAFSRRQSLDARTIEVNPLIHGMGDLLRRTFSERVSLQFKLAPRLWPVEADANQLESALLNLAINARDAMPDGGQLTIETANIVFDQDGAANRPELAPGDYVMLAVGDTGQGMSPQVLQKVFEPFFTTKRIGEGSGLGLSMIYGFAKQSRGHVEIDSAPGTGTTVKLFLPRSASAVAPAPVPAATKPQRAAAGETVMVIEDEPSVRLLITEVLEELGYAFVQANDSESALPILHSAQRIDLLVSDVGLPGMNGRQLAERARQLRPGLKVLFVTGYAEPAAIRGKFLDAGMHMMSKPFSVDALGAKIRSLLEAAA